MRRGRPSSWQIDYKASKKEAGGLKLPAVPLDNYCGCLRLWHAMGPKHRKKLPNRLFRLNPLLLKNGAVTTKTPAVLSGGLMPDARS